MSDATPETPPPSPESRPSDGAEAGTNRAALTSGAEVAGPGADAGVTSSTRATATGANLAETQANDINPDDGSESRP